MLAAHKDQENLAFSHQAGAAAKQQQQNQAFRTLQPKTPGARYPKTPLKIPLNDENATHGLGGKSILRPKNNNENITTMGKGGKSSFVTPLGTFIGGSQVGFWSQVADGLHAVPRTTRAPLGNKTTNAKARTGQVTGVKDIGNKLEKTQVKPATIKPLKHSTVNLESSKLGVHVDESNPLEEEEDIEYAPAGPTDIPYESDIIPAGALTFEGLKPENILKGYYRHYFNPVDENGVPIQEREMEERRQRDFKRLDEQVKRDMDEFDWSVGDLPETRTFKQNKPLATVSEAGEGTSTTNKRPIGHTFRRQPPTIAARKAASALALAPKLTSTLPNAKHLNNKPPSGVLKAPNYLLPVNRKAQRPLPTRESSTDRASAVAASRSTLGYSKGRSTVSVIQGSSRPRTPAGASGPPQPARRVLARSASTTSTGSDCTITPARYAQVSKTESNEVLKRLEFLSIFDADEDDGNLGGSVLPADDGTDDDFQMNLQF
jgi:hypothetical protein